MLGVWLRDVLGTFDDQQRLGQDARIGRWPISGIGEARVVPEPLTDDLLGRAAAQDALAAGVVGRVEARQQPLRGRGGWPP